MASRDTSTRPELVVSGCSLSGEPSVQAGSLLVHLLHLHVLVTRHAFAALHHLPVHHHHLTFLHLDFFPALHHHLAVHHHLRAVGQGRLSIHPGNLLPVLHHRHLAVLHHDAIFLDGYYGGS